MAVDLTPLKENDAEYESISKQIAKAYECDWNDKVHDSYLKYINKIDELSQGVHDIRCNIELLDRGIVELNVDEQISNAQELCAEAEAI